MKIRIIIGLFAVLCATAFAGTLTDTANVFGPRAAEVEKAIASLPVWIETRVATPGEGLKAYSDSKAASLDTSKAFYVVITTSPREWRVSMNPIGMASAEGVRLAGDGMVARFKRGQFAEGAIGLSHELVRLTLPTPPAPQPRAATPAPAKEEEDNFWWWVAGGFLVLGGGIWLMLWLVGRSVEKEARERRKEVSEIRSAKGNSDRRVEAQRVFDSYSPTERERIIERHTYHHSYSPGASTDPLMFWMLMNAASQPHYVAPAYEAPRHTPAPSYDPPRRETPSYDPPASSSYDSGSSSSSDSGSSSSDSSGGGGSW